METEGFKFDLKTQRFLVNRWNTELGQRVRESVIHGLKNSVEVRAILDEYVLEHPENCEPYGYPIYPESELGTDRFWVLTQDDLRGIQIYNENFPGSPSFEKKSLGYSSFYNCDLSGVNLEMTDLSFARFEKCNLNDAVFAYSGGFGTRLVNCSAERLCVWESGFRGCDFSGTDFRDAYFENVVLENIKVNYLSRFDTNLNTKWESRTLPPEKMPDVLRSIRIAYEKAELWTAMDGFLIKEKSLERKHLLWPHFLKDRSIENFRIWFVSLMSGLLSGYSTKPFRVLGVGVSLSFFYAALYQLLGTPNEHASIAEGAWEALYFSFTTFATLGYGDVAYSPSHPLMRILSTSEAWIGATVISLFVVVLARKIFR